jgi:hypothetical protein
MIACHISKPHHYEKAKSVLIIVVLSLDSSFLVKPMEMFRGDVCKSSTKEQTVDFCRRLSLCKRDERGRYVRNRAPARRGVKHDGADIGQLIDRRRSVDDVD